MLVPQNEEEARPIPGAPALPHLLRQEPHGKDGQRGAVTWPRAPAPQRLLKFITARMKWLSMWKGSQLPCEAVRISCRAGRGEGRKSTHLHIGTWISRWAGWRPHRQPQRSQGRVDLWGACPAAPSYLPGLSLKVIWSERLSLTPKLGSGHQHASPLVFFVASHVTCSHASYLLVYFTVCFSLLDSSAP